MTTNREVYEGKILETLIKNSERLAVLEQKLDTLDNKFEQRLGDLDNKFEQKISSIDMKLNLLLGIVSTVALGVLAALYSQPLINALIN